MRSFSFQISSHATGSLCDLQLLNLNSQRLGGIIKTDRKWECNFATLRLSLQVGLIIPITFSTFLISFPHPSSMGMVTEAYLRNQLQEWWAHLQYIPSYLFNRSSPFPEAGIHLCYFSPGAVSYSSHRNEYARWKDCSLVKSCALLCILNNHWSLCKNNFSESCTNSPAGLHAIKRNPTTTTRKSPVFLRQSYFS